MRTIALSSLSFILTFVVFANAFVQKKQFYPSIVYVTKSNSSTAVLYLQGMVLIYLMGKLLAKLLFGQLRPTEVEHLIERGWYAVTETCLAFAAFRDDFSLRFFTMFTLLLFVKCFHWLAEDRVDYMERSPLIGRLFHLRAVLMLSGLCLADYLFVRYAYRATLARGASVQLVFGFEYTILLVFAIGVWQKYILHSIDSRSEEPWDRKAMLLLWGELLLSGVCLVLYCAFVFIMLRVHTFPLFAVRPAYAAFRSFKSALSDLVLSRRAIRIMQQRYPDASEEDLANSDNVCIICREEMLPMQCKKLPCAHIFHPNCLRSWFQRQQTCPTCRMDILREQATDRRQQQQQPQQQQQQQPQQQQQQQQQQPESPSFFLPSDSPDSTAAAAAPSTTTLLTSQQQQQQPPPLLPADLKRLTEAELRSMEGWHREALERRVEHLQQISALLDAAVLQMGQYTALMANMPQAPPLPAQQADQNKEKEKEKDKDKEEKEAGASRNGVGDESHAAAVAAAEPKQELEPKVEKTEPRQSSSPVQLDRSDSASLDQSELRRRRLLHLSSSREDANRSDEDSLD